jgi:hypothetical protein
VLDWPADESDWRDDAQRVVWRENLHLALPLLLGSVGGD